MDWKKYVEHIYCIHSNDNNDITELKNVGIYNDIFSMHYYNFTERFVNYKYFKDIAIVDVIKDAYKHNYKSILIIRDDVNFSIDINLESTINNDFNILNADDICEDILLIKKPVIDYIMSFDNINSNKYYTTTHWNDSLYENVFKKFTPNKINICQHKIDFVISYVNSNDKTWLENFIKAKNPGNSFNAKNRWKDWGTLETNILLTKQNLPWINNIYLLVSGITQIPEWVSKYSFIKTVLHSEFIPESKLPTFNSCAIETYLYNIPGLSEHYIYTNDDVFCINPLDKKDFFENGKSKTQIVNIGEPKTNHLKICVNSFKFNLKDFTNNYFNEICLDKHLKRLMHTPHPMFKSTGLHLYKLYSKQIDDTVTQFRNDININQYTTIMYDYMQEKCIDYSIHNGYCKMNDIHKIKKVLSNKNVQVACINDNQLEYSKGTKEFLNETLDELVTLDLSKTIQTAKKTNIKIALCAIAKNENLYIREWVEYYKNLGICKIFLYDNNDLDGEHFEDVINDYIQSGFVEVIDVRGKEKEIRDDHRKNLQDICYIECMHNHYNEFDWMCYLDIDEFLCIVNKTLSDYLLLDVFNNIDTIILNWQNYGDSGNTYYENKPVQTRFIIPAPNVKWLRSNYQCKSIVRCTNKEIDLNEDHILIHKFLYTDRKVADSDGNNISDIIANHKCAMPYLLYNNAYVKHYVTKTIDEYLKRYVGRFNSNTSYKDKKLQIFGINETCSHFFKINEKTPEKEALIEKYKNENPTKIHSNIYKNINDYNNDK